jgi:hypothetical protein
LIAQQGLKLVSHASTSRRDAGNSTVFPGAA